MHMTMVSWLHQLLCWNPPPLAHELWLRRMWHMHSDVWLALFLLYHELFSDWILLTELYATLTGSAPCDRHNCLWWARLTLLLLNHEPFSDWTLFLPWTPRSTFSINMSQCKVHNAMWPDPITTPSGHPKWPLHMSWSNESQSSPQHQAPLNQEWPCTLFIGLWFDVVGSCELHVQQVNGGWSGGRVTCTMAHAYIQLRNKQPV